MDIALLTEKYPPDPGGLAVSVQRLAVLLQNDGHAVRIFTLSRKLAPNATDIVEQDGLVVHSLGICRRTDETLTAWFGQVSQALQKHPADLLHAYFLPQAGFTAVYTGRTLGLPAVVSARGNDLDRAVFDPGRAAHILYALQQAQAVTTNSHALARQASALAAGRLVHVVANGVDSRLFCPQQRDVGLAGRLGLDNLPVVGFAGEARSKKGLAPLLLAFASIATQRPAALLLVGGVRPGEDEDTLRIFCRQNPALKVVMVPYVPLAEMPGYYAMMDVVVQPSLRDGLPNALLEGMACGRAVLGTCAGGIPDALTHNQDGWLVPPGDVSALAGALEVLLEDPALRIRLGVAARHTVMERFSPEQELSGTLDVYRSVLSQR